MNLGGQTTHHLIIEDPAYLGTPLAHEEIYWPAGAQERVLQLLAKQLLGSGGLQQRHTMEVPADLPCGKFEEHSQLHGHLLHPPDYVK